MPNSTLLVVAGDVSEKKVLEEAKKVFGPAAKSKKAGKRRVKESQKKPAALVKWKQTDQTHFVVACRSYDLFNKNNPAQEVLGGILGGGMSSRLFQKLRE